MKQHCKGPTQGVPPRTNHPLHWLELDIPGLEIQTARYLIQLSTERQQDNADMHCLLSSVTRLSSLLLKTNNLNWVPEKYFNQDLTETIFISILTNDHTIRIY